MSRKIFCLLAAGLLFSGIMSCSKKADVTPVATTEEVTLGLLPANQDIKGEQFTLQLSNLKILETMDKTSKEITSIPQLKGTMKIINISKNILQIQGITFQYLDASGKPIPFKSGENNVTVSIYSRELQPGKDSENSLQVNIPVAALKNKSLSKIEANVVYVPTPLKKESVDMPVKIQGT